MFKPEGYSAVVDDGAWCASEGYECCCTWYDGTGWLCASSCEAVDYFQCCGCNSTACLSC